jgi:hypothetical protein
MSNIKTIGEGLYVSIEECPPEDDPISINIIPASQKSNHKKKKRLKKPRNIYYQKKIKINVSSKI